MARYTTRGQASGSAVSTSFAYDNLGQVTRTTTGEATLYRVTNLGGDGVVPEAILTQQGVVTEYGSDAPGRRITTKNGVDGISTVQYDLDGNVVRTVDEEGRAVNCTYDNFHRRIAQYNGVGGMAWIYDADGNLAHHLDMGGNLVKYNYDGRRQLVAQTSLRADGSAGQNLSYTYDRAG